ncbi:PTS mannitol transporter subunit IICBA [Sellimonas catena]|uniref:Mannitol-specific phosphotransferase enzyme IIA component n=2 Tax=Clostridia TaxID=186801 RepID=A0A9W6FBH8_9FIRM|nr:MULTISPECIES: PTS mannitol transporter subunit IICBA [Clostridia]MEE0780572.1 PTS mannitol transporter subunit IICBA [Sellimonas sp.]OUQ41991.1 PTS mannitol transporter subunit IICBA [Drancourtella sp. An12]GLG03099.1 PTS system mannitol-specific EIICBA component [Sellimonas catena]
MKNNIQRFGKFLSAMVMPNIGALIAFGFLAALFIDTGWIPNKGFNSMVSPMLTYLIPILIASTGGRMIGGDRGRVAGAIAVIGAIMSNTEITMLMAAMVMGPLAGFCVKKFDEAMDGHMPAGFEMLINNFSVGIIGMVLAMLGYVAIGPFMSAILMILSAGVNFLVEHSVLPLVSVFVEPAKVLFLNNALNHGIFTPIATEQAAEAGKSIMYMLETNPGPGLGVLLAYMFFCKDKVTKDSAPGAVIIHLLGGIHEIYFPYILMNPVVIVAPILGNMAAILWYTITDCGLVGPASPGSIIAYLMVSPGSDLVKVLIGVVIAAGISFVVASPIVKMAGGRSLEEAQNEMASMKQAAKGETTVPGTIERSEEVKKIIFACDAGMGSSAMGATKFRNRIKNDRPDITVSNTSVDTIPADCDIAVVQTTLAARAKKAAPQAQLITIGNFLADPALDALYVQLTTGDAPAAPAGENTDILIPDTPIKKQVIVADGIRLGQKPVTKEEAIQAAGELLVKLGYVDESYVEAMQERERLVSTYMGMGVAIPHGTTQAKGTVKKTGIVFLQYPEGVDFGAEKAQLVFGIAGIGDEHLDLLGKLCTLLEDPALLETLKTTDDVDWVLEQLS